VAGIPVRELIAEDKLQAIIQRARVGGGEIVGLVGVSAWYAPAAGAVEMVESIVLDQKRVLPCAAWLQGEYGMKDLYMGVPVVLGKNGIEKILEIPLDAAEKAMFEDSAAKVRATVAETKL
jgi:malate dehydrogenase